MPPTSLSHPFYSWCCSPANIYLCCLLQLQYQHISHEVINKYNFIGDYIFARFYQYTMQVILLLWCKIVVYVSAVLVFVCIYPSNNFQIGYSTIFLFNLVACITSTHQFISLRSHTRCPLVFAINSFLIYSVTNVFYPIPLLMILCAVKSQYYARIIIGSYNHGMLVLVPILKGCFQSSSIQGRENYNRPFSTSRSNDQPTAFCSIMISLFMIYQWKALDI